MSQPSERIKILTGHLQGTIQHQTQTCPLQLQETSSAMAGSPLTTHVLDTSLGRPAQDLGIEVSYQRSQQFEIIAARKTNSDGRTPSLLTQDQFIAGVYKIKFDTGNYFKLNSTVGFYPYVEIVFEILDPSQHYHVPLLLSPYSYSTYRGS